MAELKLRLDVEKSPELQAFERHLQRNRTREFLQDVVFHVLGVFVLLAVLLAARYAFAQDVIAAPPAQDPLVQLLVDLIARIRGGHYGVAVALGIVGVTQVVRRFGSKISFLKGPLENPVVLWALPTAGSLAAMVVTTLTAGVPIDVGMIVTAIMEGLSAVGLFVGMKKIAEAKEAGKTAADQVNTKAEAISELQKSPAPSIPPLTAEEKARVLENINGGRK